MGRLSEPGGQLLTQTGPDLTTRFTGLPDTTSTASAEEHSSTFSFTFRRGGPTTGFCLARPLARSFGTRLLLGGVGGLHVSLATAFHNIPRGPALPLAVALLRNVVFFF